MAQTSLRARLRRLFSTNVIVRHAGGRKLKIADTDRVQQASRNSLVDRWSRLHTNLATGGYGHSQAISFQAQRLALFRDYEEMDKTHKEQEAEPIVKTIVVTKEKSSKGATIVAIIACLGLVGVLVGSKGYKIYKKDKKWK